MILPSLAATHVASANMPARNAERELSVRSVRGRALRWPWRRAFRWDGVPFPVSLSGTL